MRVYSRTVWEWRGDELVKVEAECESHEYEGPVALCGGSGGGGSQNYENLNRLYGIQADQAEFLGNTFKNTVAPAYKNWLGEAQDYGSQANQEQAASRAGAAASGATSQAEQALQGNMASMGLNPADVRYQAQLGQMGIQGAAQQAAAQTTARENVRNQGFAREQDAIGMGMGTPTQASQAANSAANSATASLNAQTAAANQQGNAAAGIVRAGTNMYGMMQSPGYNMNSPGYSSSGSYSGGPSFGGADGGEVTKRGILRLKNGGYVQRLAAGGFAGGSGGGGFMPTASAPPPPPMSGGAPPQSPGGAAAGAALTPVGMSAIKTGAGKAIEAGGNQAGSAYASSLGKGLQMSPADAAAKAQQYKYLADTKAHATQLVDKEMGPPAPGETLGSGSTDALDASQVGATSAGDAEAGLADYTAATTGADAAAATGTAAATDAAATGAVAAGTEGLAASGAGLAAGATLGAAVPVLGAGLALYGIGNAAGWWADGGQVTPGSRDQTGKVDGPGGPKDDEVLAALSDGEFVMPVGAVKFFGIDRLEKMRQRGLEHEQQMGIH